MSRLLTARLWAASALIGGVFCGTAFAQAAQDTSAAAPDASGQNSVKLVRMVENLPAGAAYISLKTGNLFCIGNPHMRTWPGGELALKVSAYASPFKTEMEQAKFKVVTPDENMFDDNTGAADYEVAGIIAAEHVDGCVAVGPAFFGKQNPGDVDGEATMELDWQVYSRLQNRVVARVHTSGASKLTQQVTGGLQQLIVMAFTDNVRQLAENADFRAAMAAPKAIVAGLQAPDQQSKILLSGSLQAKPRKIADAVSSVVTIMNDLGSGSGILVSDDGYILTDAHVVGDDKQARVRWPDGIETLGQVVRVSKNRDVAIVKTDARGRSPLPINRGPVTPGERVYAIGSPKGKDFEGTVSSGIISADRTVDGLRYIQSDTTVSHGSSGGPLLNENGYVIGLTDLAIQNSGPAGLNLFTPIGDAMDFLSLQQQ
jgi:serine protease Do